VPTYSDYDDFVARASPKLFGAARLIVPDRGLAEELLQDALILVYRSWSKIRDPHAIDAYAHRTLVRLCRRRIRMSRLHRELPSTDLPDLPDRAAPVDDLPEAQEFVRAAVHSLPERQRETIALRFYFALSIDDTAQAMRCSTGTVKSQTAKALATLRTRLTPLLQSPIEGPIEVTSAAGQGSEKESDEYPAEH